jgi:uncharacterized protein YkwD
MKIIRGVAVALTAAILASGGGVATSLATAQPAQAASSQSEIQAAITQILNETNAERTKVGLAPLKLDSKISTVSQNWTESMAAQKSMTHNPDYQFQMPQPWMRVGENVGQGYTKDTIVAAWMASPGHKANILGDFTHIGLGYWVDETGRGWFTQNFGKYDTPVLTTINEPIVTADKYEFTATWDRKWEENVDSYRAELYSTNGTLLQTKTVPVADSAVTFDGLTDLTSYNVKIVSQATNALGEYFSSPVKSFNVTTLEDLPVVSAPTELALFPDETSLQAYWIAPTGYNGTLQPFKVELIKDGVVVNTAQTSDSRYTFANLNSNTTYTVKVTATTTVRTKTAVAATSLTGKTLLSSVASVTEPTNVIVKSDSYNSVKTAWEAPASKTGINLKYALTLSTAGKPDVVVETTSTSYTFTGLKAGTDYSVKVQASITSEDGSNKKTTTGVTSTARTLVDYDTVQVTAPSLLPLEVKPTYVTVSWNSPATLVGNLVNYTVTVKQVGKADRVFNTTNKFFVVTELNENTAYSFEVRANATSLNSLNTATATSNVLTATTPISEDSRVSVSAPAFTAATSNDNSLNVQWSAPSVTGVITNYTVTLKQGTTVLKTVYATGTSQSFTGLSEKMGYTVELKANAKSNNGNYTATSAIVSKAVATTLSAASTVKVNSPSNLYLSRGYTNLVASWSTPAVTGIITSYTVTIKGTSYSKTYTTTATKINLTGLKENAAYTVYVKANAKSSNGKYTAYSPTIAKSATTVLSAASTVKVSAPSNFYLSRGYTNIVASWNKPAVTGIVTSYTVTIKRGTAYSKTYTTTATKINLAGLKRGTTYTVYIQANAKSSNGKYTARSATIYKSAKTV